MSMKYEEFQAILNTFPEGVVMASYKETLSELDPAEYQPQGM